VYLLLLLIGSIGFVAMALLGFSHGGAGHMHHAFGGHGTHAALPTSHGGAAGHSTSLAKGGADGRGSSLASWFMVSPLDIFSLCLGFGVAGLAFQTLVGASILPWIAVAGALLFNLAVVRPFLKFTMRFVSKPSEGLEGIVGHTALAVTRFDSEGRGLIKVSMDEQSVQLLAILDPAELHRGVNVCKDDEVVVVEVDTVKNSCRVTRELSE